MGRLWTGIRLDFLSASGRDHPGNLAESRPVRGLHGACSASEPMAEGRAGCTLGEQFGVSETLPIFRKKPLPFCWPLLYPSLAAGNLHPLGSPNPLHSQDPPLPVISLSSDSFLPVPLPSWVPSCLHGGLPSPPSPSSFMSPGEPALSELKVESTPSKCGNKHRTNSQQKPSRSSTPRSLTGRSLKKALDPVTHCLHEGQEVMCPFYRCNK